MRHFDVQLLGGMVLNDRCIAEMRTGEGKTLTATLPAYLNALTGKGVHVVTVNDYLAQRDAENNRPLFEFLGMTVGINMSGLPAPAKREAYAADITYGTNNEYGFDYLRDNMAFSPEERVQRKLHYALVDEVDSILIDEARTPLIISGPAEDSSEMYRKVNKIIPHLIRQEKEDSDTFTGEGHFSVDEKARQVNLTERGLVLIEELLVQEGIMDEGESLYSPTNIMLMHHVTAALRAMRCSPATLTTLSKMAKLSSSMSTLAVRCRAAAGPMVCTRPLRPKRAWRSKTRTRLWPLSPSRTTSVCTRSWRG